tara:strand:- start:193 stop:630 length:438 start_codon:yes stop_codon:yes gene_type:complete
MDKGQFLVSVLSLFLVYPLVVVHEVGHAFVCAAYGLDYSISLSWFGRSSAVCLGDGFNEMVFGFAGGLLVVLILSVLLVFPFVRNNMEIKISLISLFVMALVNSLVEGMFFGFYNQNIVYVQYGLLMVLLVSFLGQWSRIIFQQK